MLRNCYAFVLRLHPAPFRDSYEKEMLAIFDDVAARGGVRGLFLDAAVSLFRQWVLRPEFRGIPHDEPVPVASGDAPLLASLDGYKPRPVPMLIGGILSVVLLAAVAAVSVRPGKLSSWMIGIHHATGNVLPVSRSSLMETEPNTLVRLGQDPENPWRAVASIYFKLIPVLAALDADGDFVISPWELATAPSALPRLDRDHDGKLSPEECGFSLGPLSREAQREFMRAHPVLAALDADHDGEISAAEIRNSSRSLRTLDSNGDGFLTANEVMPDRATTHAIVVSGK
jgi:hypothetical protein